MGDRAGGRGHRPADHPPHRAARSRKSKSGPPQVKSTIAWKRSAKNRYREDSILVTTLTKKLSEDLSKYLMRDRRQGQISPLRHRHAGADEILKSLRLGEFDVLVGINLLREGLDLPEVSLVVILDADKEGFLRSETALIQTCGRAARNIRGRVILYADKTDRRDSKHSRHYQRKARPSTSL